MNALEGLSTYLTITRISGLMVVTQNTQGLVKVSFGKRFTGREWMRWFSAEDEETEKKQI
ncbi:hypothetical protein M3210_02935 [Oceanobacillus luteolus]|uniref:hypothetical protein n=1 Tax=Oceanobacillus luteolus TaxID=1274358 RepID=UPI0020423975|nr:hypothetical protein [Oceanobacillus luteolus]MCM3739218.1 hypothetical protein [Oceanobacillus luteolus]